MTKTTFNFIVANKRWPFQFSDIFKYYFFILFPSWMILLAVSVLYSAIRYDNSELIFSGSLILIFGVFFFWFTVIRLRQNIRFETHDYLEIRESTIVKTLISLGFSNVKAAKNGIISGTTKMSGFSWGETITIIVFENSLLVNSQPNNQPITIMKDKANIKKLISALDKAFQNNIFE